MNNDYKEKYHGTCKMESK